MNWRGSISDKLAMKVIRESRMVTIYCKIPTCTIMDTIVSTHTILGRQIDDFLDNKLLREIRIPRPPKEIFPVTNNPKVSVCKEIDYDTYVLSGNFHLETDDNDVTIVNIYYRKEN